MKINQLLFTAATCLTLAACGPSMQYEWNGYNYALLKHYKDGTDNQTLAVALQNIVDKAETKGKVPPGLYAELGYAYLESGNSNEAIKYFTKEKEKWPESEQFMNSVLSRISK